jgi:hypothetical protein
MRKLLAAAAAVSVLAVAAPASAQTWQSINARQANLDHRIDVGVRNGDLTRTEAARLRAEFRDLVELEADYRYSGGLSLSERRDLDRRFDLLAARIRYERHDAEDRDRRWQPINQRQRQLEARIEAGIREGSISRREAYRLRAEFEEIALLEARYRRSNGLSDRERIDLDRRFDRLSYLIQVERRDNDYRRG